MSSMEERFKRTFTFLLEDSKCWSEEDYDQILGEGLNLTWLRNETKLWTDYEEDSSWIINGVQCDPNHPENLSNSVFEHWKQLHELGILKRG